MPAPRAENFERSLTTSGLSITIEEQVVALRLMLNLPWPELGRSVMVADLLHGTQDGAILAVVTRDRAEADRLAATARANWGSVPSEIARRSMAELFSRDVEVSVWEIGEVPILALTVHGPHEADAPFWQNRAYIRFNQILIARDIGWLTE